MVILVMIEPGHPENGFVFGYKDILETNRWSKMVSSSLSEINQKQLDLI